jgi:hypothetical protein
MKIVEIDLDNKRQVKDFLDLPFHVYREIPQWVPPLEMDAQIVLQPRRYPFYRHSQAAFFLAYADEGGSVIGRIAVLDNRRYNEFNHENTAFFFLFECEDNPEAAQGLFEASIAWAQVRGLDKMIGPKGFTPMDGGGLLVQGFAHRPAFGMPYNPAYYPKLLEAAGFEPYNETVSGYLGTDIDFPTRIHELSARVQKRRGLHIARYRTRRDLRALGFVLKDLYNNSLGGTRENTPLTDEEVKVLANQLLWFADPRLVKIVMKDDQPVGFLLAYPDVSAALQKNRGKLWPFGWISLLRELKRTDWLNINGAGLTEEYRGLGGTAILFSEMYKSVVETGQFRHADVVQIGTDNEIMLREMENFGIEFYKRHRVYKCEFD